MKRILITVVWFACLPIAVCAQSVSSGSLTIVTTPPGAEVTLEGEALLSGISPITFSYPAIGEYKLKVTKYGFETYKTRLLLDPSKPQQVAVELSPKTAVKAALRSMVFPGWGQRYTDQKSKGFLFGACFTGAALVLLGTETKFQDRQDDYYNRLAEYDRAVARGATYEQLSVRYDALSAAQKKAYDAESGRRIAAGVVIGVWGLNVIDALLFSPNERATFSIKGLSVAPTADDGFRVTLSRAF